MELLPLVELPLICCPLLEPLLTVPMEPLPDWLPEPDEPVAQAISSRSAVDCWPDVSLSVVLRWPQGCSSAVLERPFLELFADFPLLALALPDRLVLPMLDFRLMPDWADMLFLPEVPLLEPLEFAPELVVQHDAVVSSRSSRVLLDLPLVDVALPLLAMFPRILSSRSRRWPLELLLDIPLLELRPVSPLLELAELDPLFPETELPDCPLELWAQT